jgi:hypothetical protein
MKTIEEFVEELNKKWPKKNDWSDCFIFTTGKRYWKICKSCDGIKPKSAYGFVDKSNGDLYRAASWAAPAIHIRGNINDVSGISSCNEFGVRYL